MKPGCGRMLIGRRYRLANGEFTSQRPRNQDDIIDTVDEYLEQGQTKEVPLDALSAMLDAQGKPSRNIEGYPLTVLKGAETISDDQGNSLPKKIVTEDSLTAGRLYYQNGALVASHPDATFEIVQDNRAA